MEGILEVAVIGEPDPILGEAIKVYAVTSDGSINKAKIFAHCKTHLEDFMVPKDIEIRESLPKTESGKINKRLLVGE